MEFNPSVNIISVLKSSRGASAPGKPCVPWRYCATLAAAAVAATDLGVPLRAPLSTRDHMFQTRVCGSGRVPCFLNVMFLGLFCFARSAANLREAHLGWYLSGCFHLSGRAQRPDTLLNKGKTGQKHASFKRKYAQCECENLPMCTNSSQTSKKMPSGGPGPQQPPKGQRRKQ